MTKQEKKNTICGFKGLNPTARCALMWSYTAMKLNNVTKIFIYASSLHFKLANLQKCFC